MLSATTNSKYTHGTLFDAAKDSLHLSNKLHTFTTREGKISCGLGALKSSDNSFIIHYVEIIPSLRGQGRWSSLLRQLAQLDKINQIVVCGVTTQKMDNIMSNFKLNGRKFINHGGDYVWRKTPK